MEQDKAARFTRAIISTGVPFGVLMGLFFALRYGVGAGLLLGLFSGVLFGGMLAFFLEAQRGRLELKDGVFEGQPILYQGSANHFLGWLRVFCGQR